MTLADLQVRVAALDAELRELKGHVAALSGEQYIPGFGPVGIFPGVPEDDEAVRLGREWREQVNRESLEEFDREREAERQAEAKKKRAKKVAKARRPNVRA